MDKDESCYNCKFRGNECTKHSARKWCSHYERMVVEFGCDDVLCEDGPDGCETCRVYDN